ncbi:hypothetical protein ICN10_01565 [Polynucleobacter sp. 86C-FISCH]|uniref:hypothetical protein n=1 Tax=Polynucleobacter sp. 86C-FISCH TaxID=2689101 RepID=UPI001C0E845A|nr:hypothetical protein [Polynucleobacter sp. 86C-FISCH]MBU3595084.1 hypothetical protein [Polynucleobacter sp. 86C-FISCH]
MKAAIFVTPILTLLLNAGLAQANEPILVQDGSQVRVSNESINRLLTPFKNVGVICDDNQAMVTPKDSVVFFRLKNDRRALIYVFDKTQPIPASGGIGIELIPAPISAVTLAVKPNQ